MQCRQEICKKIILCPWKSYSIFITPLSKGVATSGITCAAATSAAFQAVAKSREWKQSKYARSAFKKGRPRRQVGPLPVFLLVFPFWFNYIFNVFSQNVLVFSSNDRGLIGHFKWAVPLS
ncbi:hypothetical protein V6N13_118791 [Hibiscus sabdariffa]|uniref:Uncharacterized protein n=1 Tax=Hibiscus sabdariffa TaxID=183260 RepID=A0ABR2DZP3_9ROSI